jgi:hypothetical protein
LSERRQGIAELSRANTAALHFGVVQPELYTFKTVFDVDVAFNVILWVGVLGVESVTAAMYRN